MSDRSLSLLEKKARLTYPKLFPSVTGLSVTMGIHVSHFAPKGLGIKKAIISTPWVPFVKITLSPVASGPSEV